MVMSINDPYSGNIFGRLGAGIAKGVSEELPKAVQRGATAATLERLGNQKDLTPLQQISALIGEGQMSPESAGQLLPLVQNAQKIQALEKRASSTPSAIDQQNKPASLQPMETGSMSSKNRIRTAKETLLKEPSQQDLDKMANRLLKEGSAFSVDEAMNQAKERLSQTKKSQLENIDRFKTDLNSSAARVLQGSGLNDYKDIEGRITQNQIDLGEADIAEGKNPAVVEKDRRDLLEKLGRASTQVKKTANKSLFTTRPSQKIKEWKSQKEIFDKNGYGNEFIDLVAAHQGITQMEAAHAVDPIQNKALEKELEGLDSVLTKLKTRNPFKEINQLNDKYTKAVISHINPGDNLLDVAYHFRKSGLDANQLFESIRSAENDKPFLTEEQLYQLNQPVKNDFYGDLLFEARS
jgi:hypothetical protein